MFALFVLVIQRWTASSASYMAALLPVTAGLAAGSLLDEPLTLSLLIGDLIVLVGVYVGALAPDRSRSLVP